MSRRTKLKWSSIKILCCLLMAMLITTTIYLTIYLLQSIQKLSDSNTTVSHINDIILALDFIHKSQPFNKTKLKHHKNTAKTHDLSALYDNPFKLKKCRNALADKYGMTDMQLLSKTVRCHYFSGILTRENAKRIVNGTNKHHRICPTDQRSAIRTHDMTINKLVYKQEIPQNMTWLTDIYPIYFMIAKSGSTSILGYLQQYNRYFGYDKYGNVGHKIAVNERVNVIQSDCSFTFVREPIDRFISGYYTINALLWIELKQKFALIKNETFRRYELDFDHRKRHKLVKFALIKGEPNRFKMFVKELISDPYGFTRLWQIDHIQSQTEILSIYFGALKSKLHFIGKQERIRQHWSELVSICSAFFRNNSDVIFDDKNKKKHEKKKNVGFGWKSPMSWDKDYDRFSDFIEHLGLHKIYEYYVNNRHRDDFDMNDILPPIWYYIDQQIYNDIVEYYYQDYQCFGYVPDYPQFVAKRESYINIYSTN